MLSLRIYAFALIASAALSSVPVQAAPPHSQSAREHARTHADGELASLRLERNPLAPVYVVMSRRSYDGMRDLLKQPSAKTDSAGTPLVLARIRAHQLSRVSERIHTREGRCGGYFAFSTREQAEAFLRTDRSLQAMKSLPVRVDYTLDNAATVDPWLSQVQHTNIYNTIAHLSSYQNRYYASNEGKLAAEWIRNTWQALGTGRTDVSSELFACANCATQPSVILTIRGTELPNEIVVLGAHLDSINGSAGGSVLQRAPGADDDASGIATLTEVLRVAMASGWRPKRTVKFMGYAAEEVGLRGSNAIAQAHKLSGANIVAVLQMDMTNYKTSATSIDMRLVTDYSNAELKLFLTRLFDTYLAPRGMSRGTDTCGYACSDHASWTSAGYPAGFFFEAGTGAASGGAFPLIHTANDTLANMSNSAQNSAKFAQLGLAFLGEAAKTASNKTAPVVGADD
jgi:bacterial leucyl aminopeptidase